MDVVKRLSIEGIDYACPFEHAVRPHTAQEFEDLEANILQKRGIAYAVQYCYSFRWAGRIIVDGQTRAAIGLKHDLYVPTALLKNPDGSALSDGQAEEYAKDLNFKRRHLTPDELAADRARKAALIAAAVAAGASVRQAATATGVNRETARRYAGAGEPKEDPPKKKRMPTSGHAKKLIAAFRHFTGNREKRELLKEIAEARNVPLSEDGRTWPALEAIAASLLDLLNANCPHVCRPMKEALAELRSR